MIRTMRFSFLVMFALALAGCGKSAPPAPKVCQGVNLVSQNGADLYIKARSQYALVRVLDLDGPPLAREMNTVARLLDGAITNDPRCVLFITKMADVMLEGGEINQAATNYEKARGLCEDWVPAWMGLADVATRQHRLADARSYLQSATAAVDQTSGAIKAKPEQPDFWAVLGVNIPKAETPGKSPHDPALDDNEAMKLLMNWLQESEAWTIENPGLLVPGAGGGMAVQPGRTVRRLRARIAYQQALIKLAENAKPDEVLPALDFALQWDPDFFPAKVEKAVQLRGLNQHQDAERLLRPYADSSDPKLSNNGRLLCEMASVYADWYKASKDTKLADAADTFFDKLHKLNPAHAEGYIKRAELYLAAGTNLKRADTLKTAVACLDRAKETLGQDTPQMAGLRKDLAKAQAAIGP